MTNAHAKQIHMPPTFLDKEDKYYIDSVHAFTRNGFELGNGKNFDPENPNALGFFVDSMRYANNRKAYAQFQVDRALDVGLELPKSYSCEEILQVDEPVVAKDTTKNRGEGKYELRTYEDKLRFLLLNTLDYKLAWSEFPSLKILERTISLYRRSIERSLSLSEEKRHKVDRKRMAEVENKNGCFKFERYLSPNKELNISYRLVVDAKGAVHYTTMIYSRKSPIEVNTTSWTNDPIETYTSMGGSPWLIDHFSNRFEELFLGHPNSPFHIDRKKIVSNRAQGGHSIVLSSLTRPHTDYTPKERSVLLSQNLDPDHPKLPADILDSSKRLAFIARDACPYSGIDFMQDENNRFLFLERNNFADLNPVALGFSSTLDPFECTLKMMECVAKSYS